MAKIRRQGNGTKLSTLKKRVGSSSKSTLYTAKKRRKIRKILVPLDGSEKSTRALDEAIIIAGQFNSSITAVNAIPIVSLGDSSLVKKLEKNLRQTASKILDKARTLCKKNGIKFSSKIIHGEPGIAILNFASSKKYDLIILGSSGKGIAKEIFLGSVSNYILHKARIPVLVVK